jgi:hypothetical protein
MKKVMSFIHLIILVSIFILPGCDTVKVEETIYLGNVDVQAPINTPPVRTIQRTTIPNAFKISPKFVINNNKNISTSTSSSFYKSLSPGDSLRPFFRENNLDWSFPDMVAGLDIELPVGKNVFFTGGFHFANINNQSALGGAFGIGIGSLSEVSAFRIDGGVLVQKHLFTAETVVKRTETYNDGSKKDFISIYKDEATSTNFSPYITLTYNSAYETPLNFYISGGYFSQNLLGYVPSNYAGDNPFLIPFHSFGIEYIRTDKRNDVSVGFYLISPGVIYKFMDNASALVGIKLLKAVSGDTKTDEWFMMPAIQVDFVF